VVYSDAGYEGLENSFRNGKLDCPLLEFYQLMPVPTTYKEKFRWDAASRSKSPETGVEFERFMKIEMSWGFLLGLLFLFLYG
jgi:hypothetical protein